MAGAEGEREWSTQEVVKASGVTSRALRHYQRLGLLDPVRTGAGGQRYYDEAGLLRLQRILIFRELGVGLAAIRDVLDERSDGLDTLRRHVRQLERERERLGDVLESVHATIRTMENGGELVADTMFNGFDHTQYREEVEERWGRQAYADADAWWRSLTPEEKQAHHDEVAALVAAFADASQRGLDVRGDEVQALAQRQYDWIRAGWGGTPPSAEAFTGLGQMYVDDPRFGATYSVDGRSFAAYVRDAMTAYAELHLR